jgi:hypothetical protein
MDGEINSVRGVEEFSFLAQLGQMFSVDLPTNLSTELLGSTMSQWKEYWTFPAIMAGVIAALFFLFFWDKVSIREEDTG